MALITKLLTLTAIVQLVTCSPQFIQEDVFAFPRYQVVLGGEKINRATVQGLQQTSNNVIMTSVTGQPFSCEIPTVEFEKERLEREKEDLKQETEQQMQMTIEKGLELLQPLNCIRFFAHTNQYWAYEYCHDQYVRQYHVERTHDDKVEKEKETASFYLGIFTKEVKTQLRRNGDQRYLVQEWSNGSKCDLTDKPRTIEIQYHCDLNGQDKVTNFIETSTCNYQIIISTPRLCQDLNLYAKRRVKSHQISCKPIVSEEKLIEQQSTVEAIEQEIEKLLDKVVEKAEDNTVEDKQEDEVDLLNLISELTEQINQLKLQVKSNTKYALDEDGNIDLTQLISTVKQHQQQNQLKEKAKDQHDNYQAYHQNYL